MKTTNFSENYDLCHPLLGCENSNNNRSNISNNIANSYGHQQHSASSSNTSAVETYGNNSREQTSTFEKNANSFQIKQQQRQQQLEQNKKRKRETGEYSNILTSSAALPFSRQSFEYVIIFRFLRKKKKELKNYFLKSVNFFNKNDDDDFAFQYFSSFNIPSLINID